MCDNKQETILFTTVKSHDGKFEVKIGKPINAKINFFLSFNPFAYKEFVGVMESLPYLNIDGIVAYDDGTGGIALELTENNSLSRLIEDLPELIYLYVENAIPAIVAHKGTKK